MTTRTIRSLAIQLGLASAYALPLLAATGSASTAAAQQCEAWGTMAPDQGRWPDGRIPYSFSTGYPHTAFVTALMREWENASAHFIEFVEDASASPHYEIVDCNAGGGGEAPGFDFCMGSPADCRMSLCPGNAEHELGHAIGLQHVHGRSDRDHYVRLAPDGCHAIATSDEGDFGPYVYNSVMHYVPTHPHIARWDGSSVCASISSNVCQDGPLAPQAQIRVSDGAGVMELYNRGTGWTKFNRTFPATPNEPYLDNVGLPTEPDLLALDTSPAVESWTDDSVAVYARTRGNQIVKKFFDTTARDWSAWEFLGAPSRDLSDPAVTSWGVGRTDLAVRGGSDVFIMSTPNWGTWESLGAPPTGAESAPAIATKGENNLVVLVRASDDHVYFRECSASCSGASGTWSAWVAIGSEVFNGKPAAVGRADLIDVVMHGMNDSVWLSEQRSDGWSPWADLGARLVLGRNGCADCNSPAIGSHDRDSLVVYVRGTDDHVWLYMWGPGGERTTALGGIALTSPSTASNLTPGRAELFLNMPEEYLSGAWSAGIWRKTGTRF
jgi:hypothetical protein